MNTSESEEFFFEFFTNRPKLFTIYFTLTLGISIIGAFLNSLIILVKCKNLKSFNYFDILTINMAMAQIFMTVASVFFLVDEIHYKLTNDSWCGLKFYSHTFTTVFVGYSILVSLIVSLFLKKVKTIYGIIQVLIVWMLALNIAFPYVEVGLYEVPISSGIKNLCVLKFKTLDEVKNFRIIMTLIEYLIPSGLIILISILAFALNRQEIMKKSLILYPIIIGLYFIISCSYISLVDFIYFFVGISIHMPLYTTWKLFYSTISIANAFTYFWIDQNFFHRCLQLLRLDRGEVNTFYINMRNEKDEDINKVSFEQIV